MKTTSIRSFEEFNNLISSNNLFTLSRGVSDKKYELKPSLFRRNGNDPINVVEDNLMWLFKTQGKAHIDKIPKSEIEWLILAQHHGLPTRLLDWSNSPLVALHFAVHKNFSEDGAVYFYQVKEFKKEEDIYPYTIQFVEAILPSHISRRVTSQLGAFTVHPTSNPILEGDEVTKVIVPSSIKKDLLNHLLKCGFHHGTIFPDLDGLSKYIRQVNGY